MGIQEARLESAQERAIGTMEIHNYYRLQSLSATAMYRLLLRPRKKPQIEAMNSQVVMGRE
jgi:hypothetical protein